MPSVVLSALRARRTTTVAVFVLTVLASVGASAAPYFLASGRSEIVASDVAAATADERVLNLTATANFRAGDPSPQSALRTRVEQVLAVPGATVTIGSDMTAVAAGSAPGSATTSIDLATREGVCAQLIVEGSCPVGDRDVIVDQLTAARLKVRVGDPLTINVQLASGPTTFHVTGLYTARAANSPYWAGTGQVAQSASTGSSTQPTVFVTEAGLLTTRLHTINVDVHMVLPTAAFHDGGTTLHATVRHAADALQPDVSVDTSIDTLLDTIATDRQRFDDGVLTATVELVALSWFALFLAVRQTSTLRRADIGLLRLRGGPWRQIAAIVGQQSALPMLAGVVVGMVLGAPTAALLATSTATLHSTSMTTLLTALSAAVIVGVGALAVALAAEATALRTPVLSLLRRVPRRRSRWQAPIADLIVVVIAVAGVYQAHVDVAAGRGASVFALAAPALLGLAVALVVGRTVPLIAARRGAAAMAAARPGTALAALHLARRPGLERVFVIVVVAVSVLSTTLLYATGARSAWTDRRGWSWAPPAC